jgi:cell division cycle protein 20 (cofactor of APC complex)
MQFSPLRLNILSLFSILFLAFFTLSAFANPIVDGYVEFIQEKREAEEHEHWKRTEFPEYPPSCTICSYDYEDISSCANASIVFSNIAQILFNPWSFWDVIQCACADTFQSAYPQCVDCFIQTNQTGFLVPENGNLSSVVTGIREICALGSVLFGGVAETNSQLPGQTPITPSEGVGMRSRVVGWQGMSSGVGIMLGTVIIGFTMGVWTIL